MELHRIEPSMEVGELGVHTIGRTVGPCEECPDPAFCMAEDECQEEARESLRGLV